MATQKRRNIWENLERHYCEVCNAWMGGDKQSIAIHENGKKHRDNLEKSLKKRKDEKLKLQRKQENLTKSLAQIEKIAAASHLQDVAFFGNDVSSSVAGVVRPPHDASTYGFVQDTKKDSNKGLRSREMSSWNERKSKREELAKKPKEEDDLKTMQQRQPQEPPRRITLGENEGHYTIGETYLDGSTYAPLLQTDMPAQIWTGTSLIEGIKRAEKNQDHWKTGIIARIHQIQEQQPGLQHIQRITIDFAYLKNVDDAEETMETGVDPSRLRLVVGSGDGVPDSVDEARLKLLGGEEIIQVDDNQDITQQKEVDENTGFTTWSTVTIRKVTSEKEAQDEQEREHIRKKQRVKEKEQTLKDIETRKMEEAKYASKDDSALGAYDIFSSEKGGYKGIDISKEAEVDVLDTVKSLSEGKTDVGFKKRSGVGGVQRKKKRNRRVTSADDD